LLAEQPSINFQVLNGPTAGAAANKRNVSFQGSFQILFDNAFQQGELSLTLEQIVDMLAEVLYPGQSSSDQAYSTAFAALRKEWHSRRLRIYGRAPNVLRMGEYQPARDVLTQALLRLSRASPVLIQLTWPVVLGILRCFQVEEVRPSADLIMEVCRDAFSLDVDLDSILLAVGEAPMGACYTVGTPLYNNERPAFSDFSGVSIVLAEQRGDKKVYPPYSPAAQQQVEMETGFSLECIEELLSDAERAAQTAGESLTLALLLALANSKRSMQAATPTAGAFYFALEKQKYHRDAAAAAAKVAEPLYQARPLQTMQMQMQQTMQKQQTMQMQTYEEQPQRLLGSKKATGSVSATKSRATGGSALRKMRLQNEAPASTKVAVSYEQNSLDNPFALEEINQSLADNSSLPLPQRPGQVPTYVYHKTVSTLDDFEAYALSEDDAAPGDPRKTMVEALSESEGSDGHPSGHRKPKKNATRTRGKPPRDRGMAGSAGDLPTPEECDGDLGKLILELFVQHFQSDLFSGRQIYLKAVNDIFKSRSGGHTLAYRQLGYHRLSDFIRSIPGLEVVGSRKLARIRVVDSEELGKLSMKLAAEQYAYSGDDASGVTIEGADAAGYTTH
jgi:hypothetical protein